MSSGGGDDCCKGCNSDCCSIAIFKYIFSGSFGGTSGCEGVVVVVVVMVVLVVVVLVVVVGYWWGWWLHNGGSSGDDSFCNGGSCTSCRSAS